MLALMPRRDDTGRNGGARTADALVGALNAVLGDHLHRTGNPLAVENGFVVGNRRLELTPAAISRAYPHPSGRLSVWVHGMGLSEAAFAFPAHPDRSYAALLEHEHGFTPVFFRYNTGRHVPESGEDLAANLEELVAAFPVPVTEILLAGHSMGGLVLRSACHAAAERHMAWLPLVRDAFYLGVPHLGSPLERLGRVVTWTLRTIPHPITRLIADVGDLRSAGVKDLGRGRIVKEQRGSADPASLLENPHHPLPLLPGIRHHLIVGTLTSPERAVVNLLFGDGIVPMWSASGATLDPTRVTVVPGVGHLAIAHDDAVWAALDGALRVAP